MLRNAFEDLATDAKLELARSLLESLDGKVATETKLEAVRVLSNTISGKLDNLGTEAKLEAIRVLLNNLDTKQSYAYDSLDDMMKIKSMQKKFRDSFGGSVVDTAKWDVSLGTGAAATISGGILTFGSGTTINNSATLTSKEMFTVPFRLSFNLGLSQRIANQTLYIEMISVNPTTGVPDGLHSCAFVYDGTTATQAKYSVQNNGVTALVSSAVTVPTTVGSVSLYEVEPFCDEVWFHGKTMDATAQRTNSYVRHQQIPDPNAVYKIRLRWLNGGTAPASNTNATLQFIACQDYAELTAEITAGRGQSTAGQGVGVYVTGGNLGTQAVSGTVTANQGTLTAPTAYNLNSAASTNLQFVKASAGTVYSITATNIAAATKYVKIYNKATAPTLASDTPVLTIPVPAAGTVNIPFGATGHRFGTGIAHAITGAAADTDTTAVALGDVKLAIAYI